VDIGESKKKVVTNVDGLPIFTKEEIKPKLVNQVSSSVLWQQSVEYMINEGVNTFVEIGPGRSLSGFVKRIGKAIGKEVKTLNVNDMNSFKDTVEYFKSKRNGGE